MENNIQFGFIGAGNMATAIIEGMLKSNLFLSSNIHVSHPSAIKSKKYSHLNLASEIADNQHIIKTCDVIILCVKPQILNYVCEKFKDLLNSDKHLIVSICAGIDLNKLNGILNNNKEVSNMKIARCTVNTAALIGSSCSVFSQMNLNEHDKSIVSKLLSSVGPCYGECKDSDQDAAMAVSSCGIAYMFMFADAIADGGVKMGLTRDMALKLSFQTMKGASELMQKQYGIKHHMQMKDEVCSPGGTTIQGVHELEKYGFRNSVISAVEAAALRAKKF